METNKTVLILLLAIGVLGICTPMDARMFSWTDEEGVRHYSNAPPPTEVDEYEESSEAKIGEEEEKKRYKGKNKRSRKINKRYRHDDSSSSREGTFDKLQDCSKTYERCKAGYIDSFNYGVQRCEGNWDRIEAMGRRAGYDYSANDFYQACLDSFRARRDRGLTSCAKNYERCLNKIK